MMLIQRYSEFKENGDIDEPIEVINGKKEWIEETGDVIDTFLQDFEITNDGVKIKAASQKCINFLIKV